MQPGAWPSRTVPGLAPVDPGPAAYLVAAAPSMNVTDVLAADLFRQLRAARLSEGWTQADVAGFVGCSRGQIANAEAGGGASLGLLIGYATALGYELTLEPLR